MKLTIILLSLSLCHSLAAQDNSATESIKAVAKEFIEATDVQDADRLSETMHNEAMQYVRFGSDLITFSKQKYLEQLKAKKVGGKPRSLVFGEMLMSGEGVATISLEATSTELKFLYLVSLVYSGEKWLITAINTEVSRP